MLNNQMLTMYNLGCIKILNMPFMILLIENMLNIFYLKKKIPPKNNYARVLFLVLVLRLSMKIFEILKCKSLHLFYPERMPEG